MIGVDIVDIRRIEKNLNDRFLNKIFTDKEVSAICQRGKKPEHIAGLFAAKEAVSKVFGTGIGEISFKDIAIENDNKGKPYLENTDKLDYLLRKNSFDGIEITISHEREYAVAVAVAILSKKEKNDYTHLKEPKLLIRKEDSNKGDFGRLGVVGGSKGMSGSVVLSSKAALRSGTGLVYTFVPESIEKTVQNKSLENIVIALPSGDTFIEKSFDENLPALKKLDVICYGIGAGVSRGVYESLKKIISLGKKMVIDADGLNSLKDDLELIKDKPVIITPHPKEMARLTGLNLYEIIENPIHLAIKYAKLYNIIVVLKGHCTVVACKDKYYINKTGNSGMATAGSGDVLTGIIGGLLSTGHELYDAAVLGVYLHGLAGDIAASKIGEDSLIASDIIKYLPDAFKFKRGIDECI